MKDATRHPNTGRTLADVDRLVRCYIVSNVADAASDAHVARVVARVMETGEAVWHANAMVRGAERCYCAECWDARTGRPQ